MMLGKIKTLYTFPPYTVGEAINSNSGTSLLLWA